MKNEQNPDEVTEPGTGCACSTVEPRSPFAAEQGKWSRKQGFPSLSCSRGTRARWVTCETFNQPPTRRRCEDVRLLLPTYVCSLAPGNESEGTAPRSLATRRDRVRSRAQCMTSRWPVGCPVRIISFVPAWGLSILTFCAAGSRRLHVPGVTAVAHCGSLLAGSISLRQRDLEPGLKMTLN